MFDVIREQGSSPEDINEYFISPTTGKRVYTYLHGQKQQVDYAKYGVSREQFVAFVKRHNERNSVAPTEDKPHVSFPSSVSPSSPSSSEGFAQPKPRPVSSQGQREGFLSSDGYGAKYDEKNGSLIGHGLFSDMTLQNGTTWRTLGDRAKKTGEISDGPNILGAGPGNEFEGAMRAHIKNAEIFSGLNNEYQSPEKLREINKNINQDLGSTPTNSVYNRGYQTKAKIIDLPGDRAVCAMPDKYLPERVKSHNIFKTNQVIVYTGYDCNTERLGQEWNAAHTSHIKRFSGRRTPASSRSKNALLTNEFGGYAPSTFGATAALPAPAA